MAVVVSKGLVLAAEAALLLLSGCGIGGFRLGRVRREVVSRVTNWRGSANSRWSLEGRSVEDDVRSGIMVL